MGLFLFTDYRRNDAPKGVTMLYLQCESHNISLYQRHGFKVLHQANHHMVEVTIMRYQQ